MCAAKKIFKQSVHITLFYPPTTKSVFHSNFVVLQSFIPRKVYLNRKKKNVCGSIRFSVEQWAFQGLSSKLRMCGNLSTSLIHLTLLFPLHGNSCFLSSITVHVEKPPTMPQYRFVSVAHKVIFTVSWTRNQNVKPSCLICHLNALKALWKGQFRI